MGKIKTKRAKLHIGATKSVTAMPDQKPSVLPAVVAPTMEGIFTKADIDMNALAKQLPFKKFDDTKSALTSKSFKGMNIKKIDKRRLRHEFLMKKIDMIKQTQQEAKAKKKRQKTAIVGDMKPLEDSLPMLDLLLKDLDTPQATVSKRKQESKKLKPIKKEATRKKEMLQDYNIFQQVIKHPIYKSNPFETIAEHLTNKMKQEDEMDT